MWFTIIEYVLSAIILTNFDEPITGVNILAILNQNAIPVNAVKYGKILNWGNYTTPVHIVEHIHIQILSLIE